MRDEETDGGVDGWMDEQMGGWVDGYMIEGLTG